jgi:hypothetical protein
MRQSNGHALVALGRILCGPQCETLPQSLDGSGPHPPSL